MNEYEINQKYIKRLEYLLKAIFIFVAFILPGLFLIMYQILIIGWNESPMLINLTPSNKYYFIVSFSTFLVGIIIQYIYIRTKLWRKKMIAKSSSESDLSGDYQSIAKV